MTDLTYAEAWVFQAAQTAYLAAREIGLDEITEAIGGWGEAHADSADVVDDALSAISFYSYGDVPPAPQEDGRVDFDTSMVEALAKHVNDEGLFEGRRTGIGAVAARVAELAEQRAEFGEADESEEHQRQLDALADALSDRFGIARDAPPRFNHPAGVG